MTKFLVLTEDDSTGQCIRMWEPKKGESLELLSQDENGNPFKFEGKLKEILDTIDF